MEIKQHVTDPVILAEQKAYKTSKERFRAEIKELAHKQKGLVNVIRNTSGDHSNEQSNHSLNRRGLRHLHIAFAMFRGKPIPENYWELNSDETDFVLKPGYDIESHHVLSKPSINYVNTLLKKHVTQAVHPYKA